MATNYYIVAEEEALDNSDTGGNIVILSNNWLTPKKVESFWPACKLTSQYNKILNNHQPPGDDWQLIQLKRKFFETEDLMLARKKAKQAETVSDFTDDEVVNGKTKRKTKPPKHLQESSDSENELANDPLDMFKKTGEEVKINKNKCTPSSTITSKGHTTPVKDVEIQRCDDVIGESAVFPRSLPSSHQESFFSESSNSCAKIPASENAAGFNAKTIHLLTTIVEQNNQILNWIRGQNELEAVKSLKTPIDLPVQLPLHEEEELTIIENHLSCDNNFVEFCNYLNAFCAQTTSASINQILRHCLTNDLASQFSYRGKKGKKAFEALNLRSAITRVVKKQFKLTVKKDIENDMKVWLKHAPQRFKTDLAKKNNYK